MKTSGSFFTLFRPFSTSFHPFHHSLFLLLLFLLLFLLILFPRAARAKISSGILETSDDWAFLDRFCFISDQGRLQYEFRYPKSFAVQSLLLYHDTEDQWDAVYPVEQNVRDGGK